MGSHAVYDCACMFCFQQLQLPLHRAVEMGNYQCAQVIIDKIGLVSGNGISHASTGVELAHTS